MSYLYVFIVIVFFFLMIRRPPRSTLFSLHDALPICLPTSNWGLISATIFPPAFTKPAAAGKIFLRSEEHTSELQSRLHLVCRLLLEKKNSSHILLED